MERESTFAEHHIFLFNNLNWCPLYGEIPWWYNIPDSSIHQCCEVIDQARSCLDHRDYFFMDALPNVVYPHRPCLVCPGPCKGFPDCEKWGKFETKQRKVYRHFPPGFTKAQRSNVWYARAILNTFDSIKDHTLYWRRNDFDTISLYGYPEDNNLATVWPRAIEFTREMASYIDGETWKSEEGNTSNLVWKSIPDNTDGVVILCVLAISQAWAVLNAIYHGCSENDEYILKNTFTAKDLLFKTIRQITEEDQKIRQEEVRELKGNAKALNAARKEKKRKDLEETGPVRKAAHELAKRMAYNIWVKQRKDKSPISTCKKTAKSIIESVRKKVEVKNDGKVKPEEQYLSELKVDTLRLWITKPDIFRKKAFPNLKIKSR